MQSWHMQTAQTHFPELLEHAAQDGPQSITRSGQPVAVVVSFELFKRLSDGEPSLAEFMRASPLFGHEEIEFERNRSMPREVEF